MKNYLIILSLFLSTSAFGYKITTFEPFSPYGYCPCYSTPYSIKSVYRPIYNPYSNNYSPINQNYRIIKTNYSPNSFRPIKIKKLEKRRLKTISFLNQKGRLTGFSPSINKDDMYKQMGISPYDPKNKQKYNSINCSQELFSTPSGNEMHYNNGQYYKDLRGVSGKTGVTIIYD